MSIRLWLSLTTFPWPIPSGLLFCWQLWVLSVRRGEASIVSILSFAISFILPLCHWRFGMKRVAKAVYSCNWKSDMLRCQSLGGVPTSILIRKTIRNSHPFPELRTMFRKEIQTCPMHDSSGWRENWRIFSAGYSTMRKEKGSLLLRIFRSLINVILTTVAIVKFAKMDSDVDKIKTHMTFMQHWARVTKKW